MDNGLNIIIFIAIVALMFYGHSASEQEKKKAWEKFANASNLDIESGGFPFSKTKVFGKYYNYFITLDSHYGNKKDYIRIILQNDLAPTLKNKRIDNTKEIKQFQYTDISLKTLTSKNHPHVSSRIIITPMCRKITYTEAQIIEDAKELQYRCNMLANIADRYPNIVAMGGEAVPDLEKLSKMKRHFCQSIAKQLLQDIAATTRKKWGRHPLQLICPRCLTRCGTHKINLAWWQASQYYGCRRCCQSQTFLKAEFVVAILDNQNQEKVSTKEKLLEINWLVERQLFDFDRVHIIQATDEEIERFVVQVGNDTDTTRQGTYKAPDCAISKNSKHLLAETFGKIQ